MLSADRSITAPDQLVALVFAQDAVAASQTDVQLPIAEVTSAAGNAVDAYTMPWPGQIVAVSARLSAAATAGSLTIGATINGTEQATPAMAITTEQSAYSSALRGKSQFAAGDVIGAEISTDGSWNGTSSDLGVAIWVNVDLTNLT